MADNNNAFISIVNNSDSAVSKRNEKDKRRIMKLIENIKNKRDTVYTDKPGIV